LEISPETEAQLLENARAQGLNVEAYLRWLMAEEQAEFISTVEEGLRDVDAGQLHPARQALSELGTKLGVSR
jgi:hypothetical protein